ncbi:voltage-gated hydrogen channel 1-like [Rhopilema esculentum]|uniref:voltage-gated hydrogen channel 1-like n=1 Tax=Rhopilema esculentum TaxID=499914 RepID=UPI0031E3AF21
MNVSESMRNLPAAEINDSFFSDESSDIEGSKKLQISIQYCSSQNGAIRHFRERLRKLIHSRNYQIVVITLVLLDAAIAVATLLVDDSTKGKASHTKELAEHILHDLSLAILSAFMIEIFVKLFALGLSFFKHKFEVFDACIVIISFSLDVFMLVNKEEGALSGVEFIILLRLWRISRIVNGIIMSVKRKTEEKMELLRIQRDELQEQVSKLELKLTAQTKEIQHLRAKLESLGVLPDDQPQP